MGMGIPTPMGFLWEWEWFGATDGNKLTYCSPAWSGYCTAADLAGLTVFCADVGD